MVVPSLFFKQTKIPGYLQNITDVVVNGLSHVQAGDSRDARNYRNSRNISEGDSNRRDVFAYAR